MKAVLKGVGKLFAVVLLVVLAAALVGTATNMVLTAVEKNGNPPIGKLMDIEGGKIHVYTSGTGGERIVLMPGLGTTTPVMDFMPLVRALEKDYTVSVVEPFGYGWSSESKTPRTNKNIVEETRQALKAAGVEPPYILVSHSVSGIYALYYANTYPEEIEAIIGLDSSFPALAAMEGAEPPSLNLYGIAKTLGVLRAAIALDPSLLEYETEEYSPEDIQRIGMITNWTMGNKTVANETAALKENCQAVLEMKIPETIPTRMVLSSESVEQMKASPMQVDWVREHEKLVEGNQDARIDILEGGHYIHYGNVEKIVEIIGEVSGPLVSKKE